MLILNVWISVKGLQKGAFTGVSFPYVALCPSNRKKSEFGSILDIQDEIIRLYEEAETKGFNVGESLYTQSFFFADHALLVNTDMQNRIKEYLFCKTFSCPPFNNLQNTPAIIVDDFLIIDREYKYCINKQQEEKPDA